MGGVSTFIQKMDLVSLPSLLSSSVSGLRRLGSSPAIESSTNLFPEDRKTSIIDAGGGSDDDDDGGGSSDDNDDDDGGNPVILLPLRCIVICIDLHCKFPVNLLSSRASWGSLVVVVG